MSVTTASDERPTRAKSALSSWARLEWSADTPFATRSITPPSEA